MINASGAFFVIDFITGVEGAEMFNFFFSLISAFGLMACVPVACLRLIKEV